MSESTITPDMASRVLDANWKNVVKKVSQGKTLNATEFGLLKARAGSEGDSVTHAKDVSDLARVLGVSRQTLYAWRKRSDCPKEREGGGFDVVAWRDFVRANDLKAGLLPDTEMLKARKLLAEVEDRELKVSIKKNLYTLKSETEADWYRRMSILKNLLYTKLTLETPPLCVGKDAVAIQQTIIASLDQSFRDAGKAA